MIILETKKIFREFIGLQSFGGSKYRGVIHCLVPIIFTSSALVVIFMSIMTYISNANQFWSSVAPFVGYSMITTIYWDFVIDRNNFFSIFDDMEAVVNQST